MADWLGFSDGLGDAEVAAGLPLTGTLGPLPVLVGVGTVESELAPGLFGADVEMAATRVTGVLPPVDGRLAAKTSKPTMTIPTQPPVRLSPKPRRLCGRPLRWLLFAASFAVAGAGSRGSP